MRIDLSRIEGEPVPFEERLELAQDALEEGLLEGPVAVFLRGAVRRVGDALRAEGRVEIHGAVRCARCLERVTWEAAEEIAVDLVERQGEADEEDGEGDRPEAVFTRGQVLDLEELAAQQVLLALPMRVLCRPDCAGLCPRCGGNRNLEGGCRCPPETDPRWEALRGLQAAEGTPGGPENE